MRAAAGGLRLQRTRCGILVDPDLVPPCGFITVAVNLAMVSSAQRNRELIVDLAPSARPGPTANSVKTLRGEGVLCNLRAKFAPGMSPWTRRALSSRANSLSFGP